VGKDHSPFLSVYLNPSPPFCLFLFPHFPLSYFFLLVFPPSFPQWKCREVESVRGRDSQSRQPLLDDTDEEEEREKGAEGVFIMSACGKVKNVEESDV
jgi:hypothetical protein